MAVVPIIVGPTAVGKTAVSLALAEAVGGEVVSLDSRLFYRRMDIGTAKPTRAEQERVRHHLVDLVDPDQSLSLSEVIRLVEGAMADIISRGRQPILVGGTGQYVRALTQGWNVPEVPPDMARRQALVDWAGAQGPASLHARLAELDAEAAARIDARNVRRVVRAIEVAEARRDGAAPSERTRPPAHDYRLIGLSRPRSELFERLDARLDQMLADGLEREVAGLIERGYAFDSPAMSAVGYAEWRPLFEGREDRAATVAAIRKHLRVLVRRQGNWFRPTDPAIRWFEWDDQAETLEMIIGYVRGLGIRTAPG